MLGGSSTATLGSYGVYFVPGSDLTLGPPYGGTTQYQSHEPSLQSLPHPNIQTIATQTWSQNTSISNRTVA
jgi:hypothetical protein